MLGELKPKGPKGGARLVEAVWRAAGLVREFKIAVREDRRARWSS